MNNTLLSKSTMYNFARIGYHVDWRGRFSDINLSSRRGIEQPAPAGSIEKSSKSIRYSECRKYCSRSAKENFYSSGSTCKLWTTTTTEVEGIEIFPKRSIYNARQIINAISNQDIGIQGTIFLRFEDDVLRVEDLYYSSEEYSITIDISAGRTLVMSTDHSCELLLEYGKDFLFTGDFVYYRKNLTSLILRKILLFQAGFTLPFENRLYSSLSRMEIQKFCGRTKTAIPCRELEGGKTSMEFINKHIENGFVFSKNNDQLSSHKVEIVKSTLSTGDYEKLDDFELNGIRYKVANGIIPKYQVISGGHGIIYPAHFKLVTVNSMTIYGDDHQIRDISQVLDEVSTNFGKHQINRADLLDSNQAIEGPRIRLQWLWQPMIAFFSVFVMIVLCCTVLKGSEVAVQCRKLRKQRRNRESRNEKKASQQVDISL